MHQHTAACPHRMDSWKRAELLVRNMTGVPRVAPASIVAVKIGARRLEEEKSRARAAIHRVLARMQLGLDSKP